MTNTAVSAGIPPIASEIPRATGAVVDFGANDSRTSVGKPKARAKIMAEPAATIEPVSKASTIGATDVRIVSLLSQSGKANATVAGPSRKWINWAPSK